MQRQLDQQQQQLSNLWDENQSLKQVKDELVPGLVERGLLAMDQQKGQVNVVNNWEEHQALLAENSKRKMRQSQESQQNFEVVNNSDH